MNEEAVQRLEAMMRDSRMSSEKVQKEYNQLSDKVVKLHHDLEEQIHTNTQLLADNSQKQVRGLRVWLLGEGACLCAASQPAPGPFALQLAAS